MTEARFTPGPWLLAEGNCSCFVYALDETVGVNRFSCLVQGGYTYHGRTHKDRTSEEELHANARLIAASPSLFYELRDAIPLIEHILEFEDIEEGHCAAVGDQPLCGAASCQETGCIVQRLSQARAAIALVSEGE